MPGYTACECRASNETCITPYGEHIGKKQRECTHFQDLERADGNLKIGGEMLGLYILLTVLMLQELYSTVYRSP
jgi:hypothetical protein